MPKVKWKIPEVKSNSNKKANTDGVKNENKKLKVSTACNNTLSNSKLFRRLFLILNKIRRKKNTKIITSIIISAVAISLFIIFNK